MDLQPGYALRAVAAIAACWPIFAGAEVGGVPEADIAISVDDGVTTVSPEGPVTWTIAVENLGPSDALAQVFDSFPEEAVGVEWECTAAGGAICSPQGSGDLSDLVFIPTGGTLTYYATATIEAELGSQVSDSALVGTLNGIVDPDPDNNVSTDVDDVAYTQAPVVSKVDSATSPPYACSLYDGIETTAGITQITLRFSQRMLDPSGDTQTMDVTNPDSYRVVEAGANGTLDTTSCADAPALDDVSVPIIRADYDDATKLAALHVDAQLLALPAGAYRVLACNAGLANASGIPLGDGSAPDFKSDFRVLGDNLLINPNFDHPIDNGWTMEIEAVLNDLADSGGDPFSGSASILGPDVVTNGYRVVQCVRGLPPGVYRVGLNVQASVSAVLVGFRSGPDCDGDLVGVVSAGFLEQPSSDWNFRQSDTLRLPAPAPPDGYSAFADAVITNVAPDTYGRIDSVFVHREDDDVIFRSGTDDPTHCASF